MIGRPMASYATSWTHALACSTFASHTTSAMAGVNGRLAVDVMSVPSALYHEPFR
jgi:hypothetical protein